MPAFPAIDEQTRTKLLLVLCGICWGVNWPLIKIGIGGLTPWSYRLLVFVVGAVILMAVVIFTGRRVMEPRGMTWVHLFASSMLNVAAFGIFSTFAMLTASTSRVAVVSYSFPVWACLLAWLVLGEKLRGGALLGLALCLGGLAVLVYPVIESSAVIGLGLSLASAMAWAIGTIYLKLVRIPGDMLVNTAWQIAMAMAVMFVLTVTFQGWPTFEPVPPVALAAAVLNGLFGSAVAYLLWYHIVGRLPATTASLGSLMSPAVGVVSAVLILGEWPSAIDVVGFTLIFAAAVSAILQPRSPAPGPEARR
ncbi:MAG: DMT family transporter [Alphaproteobacteria bacterium]|nr:DMT family transporter [Alphaproteobacteria bacterium]